MSLCPACHYVWHYLTMSDMALCPIWHYVRYGTTYVRYGTMSDMALMLASIIFFHHVTQGEKNEGALYIYIHDTTHTCTYKHTNIQMHRQTDERTDRHGIYNYRVSYRIFLRGGGGGGGRCNCKGSTSMHKHGHARVSVRAT